MTPKRNRSEKNCTARYGRLRMSCAVPVDGWDFKNYVLGTMFYRYISENLCNYINDSEAEAGNDDFDFAKMPDEEAEEAREGLVEEKGFFILPSELFCNGSRKCRE